METEIKVRRGDNFFNGINPDSVGEYLKELKRVRQQIEDDWDVRRLTRTDKLLEDIKRAIDDEIELCQFYFEFRKAKKAKDYNTWKLVEGEDEIAKIYPYGTKPLKAWIINNGKIECRVEVSQPKARILIELKVHNASDILTFSDNTTHSSVYRINADATVEELKKIAEELLKKHVWPRYSPEKRRFEQYSELLGVVEDGN